MIPESQVGNFLDKAAKEIGDASANPNATKVAFKTNLVLTAEQEASLISHAFQRMQDVIDENGRDNVIQPMWWNNLSIAPTVTPNSGDVVPYETFLGKRCRYDAMFLNDVKFRPFTMGGDNIFMHSNICVPLTRRITSQMIAKAQESFTGSDPWMSIDPIIMSVKSQLQKEKLDRIQRFVRDKFKEAGVKYQINRAIKQAMVLGECAVKVSYRVRDQIFNTDAEVLVDVTGEPVRGQDGNHITKEDRPMDSINSPGTQVLERDGVTPWPEAPVFQSLPIDKRQVLYEGVEAEPIFFKDFGCPLIAKNEQEADILYHRYDKNVMEFVDMAVKQGLVDGSTPERQEAARRIVATVQSLNTNDQQAKAAADMAVRPNETFAPGGYNPATANGPRSEFVEFYVRYDANQDGITEDIMLICDVKSRQPVYYDYVANVTTNGKRPIKVVRVKPIEGRWYGMGIMEYFETYQTIVDLLVNRWNFGQSRAGRIDIVQPHLTLEGDDNPGFKINYGTVVTAKPGVKPEDIITSKYLNDIKFESHQTMMQFFLQLAYNESGVSNANDDQAAGMQSAKLATGILNVEKTGDQLFKPLIADLTQPIEELVTMLTDVTLANMNPEEVVAYEDGDTMGVEALTPEDVRGLRFKGTIELTTHKNQQTLQMCAQATALVEKFYMLAPQIQQRVFQFYQRQLAILDPTCEPEEVIVAMDPMEMPPPGQPGAAPMPGAPKPGDPGPHGSSASPAQLSQASRPPGT